MSSQWKPSVVAASVIRITVGSPMEENCYYSHEDLRDCILGLKKLWTEGSHCSKAIFDKYSQIKNGSVSTINWENI